MKTIYLCDDLNEFLIEVREELKEGQDFIISMHGYKAIVYKNQKYLSVRRGILRKLDAIRTYEINKAALERHPNMSEHELEILTGGTPDDLMDACMDVGIVTTPQKKHI